MSYMKFSQYVLQVLTELPEDKIVRKTMSGPWTAKQVISMIEEQSNDVKIWVSDLLRVFRDVVMVPSYKSQSLKNLKKEHSDYIEIAQSLDNTVFKALLKEVDSKQVVFRNPARHVYTAHELHAEFDSDSDVCTEYKALICKLVEVALNEI